MFEERGAVGEGVRRIDCIGNGFCNESHVVQERRLGKRGGVAKSYLDEEYEMDGFVMSMLAAVYRILCEVLED